MKKVRNFFVKIIYEKLILGFPIVKFFSYFSFWRFVRRKAQSHKKIALF